METMMRGLRGGLIPSDGESENLINEAVCKYLEGIKGKNLWTNPLEFYIRAQEALKYCVTQRTKYFPELYTTALEIYQELLYFLSAYVWQFPDEIKGKLLKIKALYTSQELSHCITTPVGDIRVGVERKAKSRCWFPYIVFGEVTKANYYISSPELSVREHQLKIRSLYNEDTHSFWGVEIMWKLRRNKVYLWEIHYDDTWYFSLVRECLYHQLPTYNEKRQGNLLFSSTPPDNLSQYKKIEEIPHLLSSHKINEEIEEIWEYKGEKWEIYYLKLKNDTSPIYISHSSHHTIKVEIKEGEYLKVEEFPGETHYTPRGMSD